MPCKECGSHAINHSQYGRDGSDGDLCDACYWRKRAERAKGIETALRALIDATALHHRNMFDIDNLAAYNCAKADAIEVLEGKPS